MTAGRGKCHSIAVAGAPSIGIDLDQPTAGRVLPGRRGHVHRERLGHKLTPSVVALDPRRRHCWSAGRHRTSCATRTGRGDLQALDGRRREAPSRQQVARPVELSAYVLDSLRTDAEAALGVLTRCVVTVPAYFNDAQRFATKQAPRRPASRRADPQRADRGCDRYGLDRRNDEATFLVFDLAAARSTSCVMELFEGMLAVTSVAGDSRWAAKNSPSSCCSWPPSGSNRSRTAHARKISAPGRLLTSDSSCSTPACQAGGG